MSDSPRNQQAAIKKMRNDMGMQAKVSLWDESTLERAMDKWTRRNERLMAENTSPRRRAQTARVEKTVKFGDGFEMPLVSARRKVMEEGKMKVPWRRHDDVALTTALARYAPSKHGTF